MNKNKLTNVCGLIIAICGSVLGLIVAGALHVPDWVTATLTCLSVISTAIIGWATGKPPVV